MRIARRNGRPLMLAAGGVALAASLFFTAQRINVPVYLSDTGSTAGVAEPVVFPSIPVRDRMLPVIGSDGNLASQLPKPDLSEPAMAGLVQEPLPAMEYPVGTDSAPQMAGGSTSGNIEFPWALGVAGENGLDRWAPAGGATASYPLELPLTYASPVHLPQYGGAPNAPYSSARTYKVDAPDELPVVIATPEPSVLALLGFGFVLAGIRRMVRR